jgi:hypothetical protein
MDVRDAEVWQLVDVRLDEVRRLPYDELLRLSASAPEVELLERPSGAFRRRTRVIALPNDRLGIKVRVDVEGRRRAAEGESSSPRPAPWHRSGHGAASRRAAIPSRSGLARP